MKQVGLSERQTSVLMNLGRALDDALIEFRGKTVSEVATVAHSAYSSMVALQLPSLTAPTALVQAPVRKQKRAKAKKKKPAKAKSATAKSASTKPDDKTVSIMEVLRKAKKPLPASEISERTGIPGQGLGPTLNMMFGNGSILKKEVDGVRVWGSKLNGKGVHAPN